MTTTLSSYNVNTKTILILHGVKYSLTMILDFSNKSTTQYYPEKNDERSILHVTGNADDVSD